jgi:hypothetical protein
MNEDLEKRIQEIEAGIEKTRLQHKEPNKLYYFEPNLSYAEAERFKNAVLDEVIKEVRPLRKVETAIHSEVVEEVIEKIRGMK